MKISETTHLDEDHEATSPPSSSTESTVKVCVNGLLMSKAGIENESSMTLSIYEYVADDDDILKAYTSLGIDPYCRIKCNKCNLLDGGHHLYRVLEHMNDHHRASVPYPNPTMTSFCYYDVDRIKIIDLDIDMYL